MNGREARDGEIRGGRQYRFMENFAYSREAGSQKNLQGIGGNGTASENRTLFL